MTRLFDAKPFIIAEIGSNWTDFDEAKDSISFAKQSGADAVKFQLFDSKSLYGQAGLAACDGSIPIEWLPKLKEKADACGIEFMCSAFSPEFYDVIDPYVNVHKIASSELTYPHLLDKVASKGKPILLSVGGSNSGDIALAIRELTKSGNRHIQLVLLYCVSSYPSKMYNLFYMNDLRNRFSYPVGFSDHSVDVFYPTLSAVQHFGAIVIEKHVNFTDHVTADSKHSLSGHDFTLMCEVLRGKRDSTSFNPMPEEHDMFLKHNRRLVAMTDIKPGEPFKYGVNFGCYRTLAADTKGWSCFYWEELVKSSGALRFIKAGTPLCKGDHF